MAPQTPPVGQVEPAGSPHLLTLRLETDLQMWQGTSAASCRLFINIHKWKQRPSVREHFLAVAAQGHCLERCWVRGSGGGSLPSPGLPGPRVVRFLDAMSVQPPQEKERNIDVKENHRLVTFSCAPRVRTEPATLRSMDDAPAS